MFSINGSEYIRSAIGEAIKSGERSAVIGGNWEIAEAVRLPSDFTLILDSCHLKLADNCYSNVFVNERHGTPAGKTVAGRDHNIRIIGKGASVIDGGNYNGLGERNENRDGRPSIWKNNLILFTNVEGFEIRGLKFINQRWWALNFIFCSNGIISDIDFRSNDIWVDDNGEQHHGLKNCTYEQILVKNADGIDLRQGCHDIVIENISGFCEDDCVALTGLNGTLEKEFTVDGLKTDICNVTIKNINTSSYCSNVRLLNQGEICLHDILIDGVYDTSENSEYMDRALYGVRVGDANHMYGSRNATEDETYNITIKNVRSRAAYALHLAGAIKDLVIENVETFDGAKYLEDKRTVK